MCIRDSVYTVLLSLAIWISPYTLPFGGSIRSSRIRDKATRAAWKRALVWRTKDVSVKSLRGWNLLYTSRELLPFFKFAWSFTLSRSHATRNIQTEGKYVILSSLICTFHSQPNALLLQLLQGQHLLSTMFIILNLDGLVEGKLERKSPMTNENTEWVV